MAANSEDAHQLLPEDKRFQTLLLFYLSPYVIYVSLSSIPEPVLSADVVQGLKLLATGAVLLWFGRHYRFGPLRPIAYPHRPDGAARGPVVLGGTILPVDGDRLYQCHGCW